MKLLCHRSTACALLFQILPAAAAPVPQWGPTARLLKDGAFAKEGLDTDNSGQCYSAGFETLPNRAILVRRSPPGVLNGTGLPPAWMIGGVQDSAFAGVDAEAGGAFSFAVGTHYPAGANSPVSNLLVAKYDSAMNPVASFVPAVIPGLPGAEMSGCRVIISPFNVAAVPVIFVCGCTENGIFVLCLDRQNLLPLASWGNSGAFSVAGSCPKHAMPGIFTNQPIFSSCRQSFIELSGTSLYLAGTLNGNFVAARVNALTGALVAPFLVKFTAAGTSNVKAMAVAGTQANALVTLVGGTVDVGWRANGAPAFLNRGQNFFGNTLLTMNDVEMQSVAGGHFLHIGGKQTGGFGQVWRFWQPIGGGGVLVFSRPYGVAADAGNEVYDLALGTGAWPNWTFATGGKGNAGSYDAPLLEVDAVGTATHAAPINAQPTWPDRGNAALYHAGGTVFTHGNQDSQVAPSPWDGRNVRWNP